MMNSIDIANCLNQIFCILSDNMDFQNDQTL